MKQKGRTMVINHQTQSVKGFISIWNQSEKSIMCEELATLQNNKKKKNYFRRVRLF